MHKINSENNRIKPLLLTIISSLLATILLIIGFNMVNDPTSDIIENDRQNIDENTWPREVTGLNGTISISEKPLRIVTASVGHDELTVALVKLDRLVGVAGITKDKTYSNIAGLVQNIPSIDRDPENIVALNPDIVVTSEYFPEESIQRLNDLNIPVVQTGLASSIEEQMDTILLLGWIYGEEERATELVAEIAERYDFIDLIIQKNNTYKKKKVLSVTRYSDQIWAAGSNSTEGTIIESAGGINAAAESGIAGNMTTSIEGVIEMDPEIIIITQPRESGGDEFLDDLVSSKVTQAVPAVVNNQIYFMETKYFTTLSFWNLRGVEELAKLLWAEDIGDKSFGGFSLP